jgi:hypothetical protein
MGATEKAREAQVLEIERSMRQLPCGRHPCKTPKNLMPLDAGQEEKTAASLLMTHFTMQQWPS